MQFLLSIYSIQSHHSFFNFLFVGFAVDVHVLCLHFASINLEWICSKEYHHNAVSCWQMLNSHQTLLLQSLHLHMNKIYCRNLYTLLVFGFAIAFDLNVIMFNRQSNILFYSAYTFYFILFFLLLFCSPTNWKNKISERASIEKCRLQYT